ncbi:hypothetical protein ACFU6S_32870, partial [Streptomyces sp. NPDC057456]|uniref:hypothetical protein n=1 Tax=Streptomyces sp. NPDC057456 TaxID=3346139 RepID=UPI0036A682CC
SEEAAPPRRRRHVRTHDWSHMRAGHTLVLALALAALTAGCTEETREPKEAGNGGTPSVSQPPTWEGKGDEEAAMKRATRALNAVEPDSASREDSGTVTLAHGLDRTFTVQGDKPYTFDIACQATVPHIVALTLARGDAESEWEVECGDREADQFNIPAGAPFTATITPVARDTDGLVLWRLNTVASEDVQDCEDEITECGS